MARKYVCKYKKCNKKELKQFEEDMIVEIKVNGKNEEMKIRYHKDCYNKKLKEDEFFKEEAKQQDELNSVVCEIYNVKHLSKNFWSLINDLRNGTNRFRKFFKKKYKEGVPYDVIKEAYIMSKDNIEWARLSKHFKTKEDEIRYGMIIMQSKINDAYNKIKRTKQSKRMAEAKEEQIVERVVEEAFDDRGSNWKRTSDSLDMSDILGD